jgi:hypothetical protein
MEEKLKLVPSIQKMEPTGVPKLQPINTACGVITTKTRICHSDHAESLKSRLTYSKFENLSVLDSRPILNDSSNYIFRIKHSKNSLNLTWYYDPLFTS